MAFLRTLARRGGAFHYSGPVIPGYGQIFAPLPKVPENLKGKYLFGNGMHPLPYLMPVDSFYPALGSVILGLFLGHECYGMMGGWVNPPNPPRCKADDEKRAPKFHPHTVDDD